MLRFLVPLLHPECRDSRAGIDPVQARLHVQVKFCHDRPNRMAHQLLGPFPDGVLFFRSRNVRLRFSLGGEDAYSFFVRVDRHELVAIPLDPVIPRYPPCAFRMCSRGTIPAIDCTQRKSRWVFSRRSSSPSRSRRMSSWIRFVAQGRHCLRRSGRAGASSESNSTNIIATWLGTASVEAYSQREFTCLPFVHFAST
jgi:hypothetical protein